MSTLNIAGNTAAEVVFASAGADTAPILGTLQTITTDMVILPISGGQWATAKFSVGTGGTATATAQVSIDGGKNYFASAYAKRISAVSANPTVQAISATALVTGDIWEVPLPGNCTHFQLLCGGSGTATTVTLSGGALYVPGVPVVAVLYDVTSGAGAPLDTGILDFSGWAGASFHFGQSVAQATPVAQFLIKDIDDSGTPVQIDLWYSPTSAGAVAFRVTLGRGVSAGQTSTNGDTSSYSLGRLSKRSRATTATTALAVSRIRIEVDR